MVPGGVWVRALASEVNQHLRRSRAGSARTVTGPAGSSGRSSRQWWRASASAAASATRASLTASTTNGSRSVLSYESGRPASSRASSSRSSTRPVIRSASDSIRPSACRVTEPESDSSRPVTRRVSSAYPRIEASGVRRSWLASATNCRTRVSLS
ncbi:hypothetical protein SMICM304S_11462 [Streptomyces microflavus]